MAEEGTERMSHYSKNAPISFKLGIWYGIAFAGSFVLYGIVSIILSFMDNSSGSLSTPIFFAILGVILIAFVFLGIDGKKIGWYGLIGINALTLFYIIYSFNGYVDVVLGLLALTATVALVLPTSRSYLASVK